MRLTLRTLLAYLDDTLEASQAKLIGQKIAESDTAKELIARIKEVVRRRRLTTPPTGPGAKLDPNMVAEYIDSVLTPEQLAEVEAICLESDVHLAEIAACHQILTVLLSEPVLVPPTARQRMYGIIRGPEAIPYRKPAHASTYDGAAVAHSHQDYEEDETLLLGLPLYRGKGSWYAQLAAVAVVSLLAVGITAAIWQALPSSPPEVKHTQVVEDRYPPNEKQKNNREEKEKAEKSQAESSSKESKQPVQEQSPPIPKPGGSPQTTAKEPEKQQEAPPVDAIPAANPPSRPSTDRKAVGKFDPGTAVTILLQKRDGKDSWQRLVRDNSVSTNDLLVSLPGYRSEIRLDNGLRLDLWGDLPIVEGTSQFIVLETGVRLHSNPEFDLDLTLDRGRITISNHKAQGQALVRLRFQEEVWDVTLLESGAEVAVELLGLPDFGFNRQPNKDDKPLQLLEFVVLHGEAYLKAGYETHLLKEPRGRARFAWYSSSGPLARPQLIDVDKLPPWTRSAEGAGGKEIQAQRQTALDRLATRLGSKAALEVVLQENLKDKDPASRQLAVYCLGATDELPSLLEALEDQKHSDVRLAAITALRCWIGRRAENDQILYRALEAKYKSGLAEIIMELLHPYSERQRQEPETYETFVAFLKHDKLPIRELAYRQLITLVPEGGKIPYDPAGGAAQRDRAFQEWKKKIPTGKLPQSSSGGPKNSGK